MRQGPQFRVVPVREPPAGLQGNSDPFELRQAQSGLDVRHPIVEADDRKPVAAGRIDALASEQTQSRCQFWIVGRDHPALSSGDDLVAEEAEGGTCRESADAGLSDLRTMSLRGILDDEQPVPSGNRV